MLSGIRKGKKAAKRNTNANKQNQEAAQLLRQSLAQGGHVPTTTTASLSYSSGVDALQNRGRIQGLQSREQDEDTRRIVIMNPNNHNKREADMTVQELVHHERHYASHSSWDEEMARNLIRTGGKKRRKTNNEDSDDEVERLRRLMPHQETTQNVKPKAVAKAQARQRHRLVHQHRRQEGITSKCAWWLESSSFVRHRLVAVGNHVSLVVAPPNMSLANDANDPNFYLVPIKHASSFVSCEPEVWEEVHHFVHSLNQVFASQHKRMVLMETVLPQTNTTGGLWQTKFHVVPVPTQLVEDCPMYFQSALREQIQDWGTHTNILKTTRQKQLYHVIPKQKFAYFYVMWGNGTASDATGYAMILEESRRHHQDTVNFGLDTLASMMELDPIRLQRKRKYDAHQEKQDIQAFLVQWKEHDWTLQLDE